MYLRDACRAIYKSAPVYIILQAPVYKTVCIVSKGSGCQLSSVPGHAKKYRVVPVVPGVDLIGITEIVEGFESITRTQPESNPARPRFVSFCFTNRYCFLMRPGNEQHYSSSTDSSSMYVQV